jgi:hypothetical protein
VELDERAGEPGGVWRLDQTARTQFKAEDFGERSLGSLLRRLKELFELPADESNPIVYHVRLKAEIHRAPVTGGTAQTEAAGAPDIDRRSDPDIVSEVSHGEGA